MLAFKRKIPGYRRNKSLQQPSGRKWRRKREKAIFFKVKLAWKSTTRFINNNMVGEEFWRKSDVQSVREACAV